MYFITFEGCDGSGKTTQALLLKQYLEAKGLECIVTKEPGGTPLANQIRSILLENEIQDAGTEFALLTAARRDHVINLIQPALASNKIVICDRFLDSSLVYQGICKGLDIDLMLSIHQSIIGNIMPNITFLLNLDPVIAISRMKINNRELNHYDEKPIIFHQDIHKGFLNIAKRFAKRFVIIDGARDAATIAKAIQLNIGLSIK